MWKEQYHEILRSQKLGFFRPSITSSKTTRMNSIAWLDIVRMKHSISKSWVQVSQNPQNNAASHRKCCLPPSFIRSDFDPSFTLGYIRSNPVLGDKFHQSIALTSVGGWRWIIAWTIFFLFHFITISIIHNGAKSHIHNQFTPRLMIEPLADCTARAHRSSSFYVRN